MSFAVVLCALLLHFPDDDSLYVRRDRVEKFCRGGREEVKKAVQELDEMQKILQEHDDGDWRLYVRWRRAFCSHRLGQRREARQELEEALKDPYAPKQPLIVFFIHRDLGECYLRGWMIARAKPHLEWAQAEAAKLVKEKIRFKQTDKVPFKLPESEEVRIRLLNAECFIYLAENDKAREAITAIQKTIEAHRTDKGRLPAEWERLALLCQGNLAELDRRNGDPVVGIANLRKCLAELEKKDDAESARLQFVNHIDLARNYGYIARFLDARDELSCAEKILRSKKLSADRFESALTGARATLQFEEIAFTFEQNLESDKILDRLGQAEQLATKALGGDLKSVEDSADNLDYSTVTWIDLLAQIHELRGRVHEFKDDAKKAAEEYQFAERAYDLVVKQKESMLGPGHDYVVQVRRRRARLALRRGGAKDLEVARTEARKAFELFAKTHGKDDVDRGDFLQLLAAIESRAGNFKEAAGFADEHRKLSARRLASYLASLTSAEQIKFFRMWDDPGLYTGLRLGIRDEDSRERSAEWLMNGKAKIAEVLAGVNHLSRGSDNFKALQESIRRQAYLLHGSPDATETSVRAGLLREEARQRELVGTRTFKPGKPWYSLDELRGGLAADEVFIDVFCLRPQENGPRVYYAWIIPPTGKIAVVELGKAEVIDRLVKLFVEHQEEIEDVVRIQSVAKAEAELHKESLDRLSQLVLDPVWKYASKYQRWTISPDGPLWGMPWEALVLPKKGENKYLYAVEEIRFRYVLSGRDLVEKPQAPSDGDPWILGDPEFNWAPTTGNWRMSRSVEGEARKYVRVAGQLKFAEAEGKEVADCLKDYFRKRDPHVQSRQATKDALLTLSPPPRILYLSTHGFSPLNTRNLPVDDPLLCCGVALAGFNYLPARAGEIDESLPGLMTGAEVLAVDLRGTELVVLSACQTGKGMTQYGQSPADLRHAFHLAGARAVVATLWSVDDPSTKDIMVPFMRLLAGRKLADKSSALRAAQLDKIRKLRNSLGHHSHPFFWAGLTLSGS